MLLGSAVQSSGGSMDAAGGLDGGGVSHGGDGRFLFGSNNGASFGGTVANSSQATGFSGPRADNPFVKGTGDSTPFIPNLVGGAELYGLLEGLTVDSPEFDAIRAGAPLGAVAALWKADIGPAPYNVDFVGFDMLLLLNLSDNALVNPMLGVDPGNDQTFLNALLGGGYTRDPLFGGSGDQVFSSLAAKGIYATLVAEGNTAYNFGANGLTQSVLGANDLGYLGGAPVPEPATWTLLGAAVWGLGARRRRRAA
jgi:hypothetical protein